MARRKIFVSYAREDEPVARAIAEALSVLSEDDCADTWFDRDLAPGQRWETELGEQIAAADLVLILVSTNYLAYERYANTEELDLVHSAEKSGTKVVPVTIDDDASWQDHPFLGSVQAWSGGKPLHAPNTKTFRKETGRLADDVRSMLCGDGESEEKRWRQVADNRRVDDSGLARQGSQLQTQLWVNTRADELSTKIRSALGSRSCDGAVEWKSPLSADAYREYRDAKFLEVLGLGQHSSDLRSFWPARGPRWDALALVRDETDQPCAVWLCEGKSYPDEMKSATRAEGASRTQIANAIRATQDALDVPPDPEAWLASYYQLANRIAHAVWLQQVSSLDVWFVHLLFTGDPIRPTSAQQWQTALDGVNGHMNLETAPTAEVYLPALERKLLENASDP